MSSLTDSVDVFIIIKIDQPIDVDLSTDKLSTLAQKASFSIIQTISDPHTPTIFTTQSQYKMPPPIPLLTDPINVNLTNTTIKSIEIKEIKEIKEINDTIRVSNNQTGSITVIFHVNPDTNYKLTQIKNIYLSNNIDDTYIQFDSTIQNTGKLFSINSKQDGSNTSPSNSPYIIQSNSVSSIYKLKAAITSITNHLSPTMTIPNINQIYNNFKTTIKTFPNIPKNIEEKATELEKTIQNFTINIETKKTKEEIQKFYDVTTNAFKTLLAELNKLTPSIATTSPNVDNMSELINMAIGIISNLNSQNLQTTNKSILDLPKDKINQDLTFFEKFPVDIQVVLPDNLSNIDQPKVATNIVDTAVSILNNTDLHTHDELPTDVSILDLPKDKIIKDLTFFEKFPVDIPVVLPDNLSNIDQRNGVTDIVDPAVSILNHSDQPASDSSTNVVKTSAKIIEPVESQSSDITHIIQTAINAIKI